MKVENQVCTLEQAKRLKALGVSQDSYFSWCGDEEMRLMDNGRDGVAVQNWVFISTTKPFNNMELDYRQDVPSAKPFAAAYTVAEVMTALNMDCAGNLPPGLSHYHAWLSDQHINHQSAASLHAALLLHLIESKLLTIEEVNKRLQH